MKQQLQSQVNKFHPICAIYFRFGTDNNDYVIMPYIGAYDPLLEKELTEYNQHLDRLGLGSAMSFELRSDGYQLVPDLFDENHAYDIRELQRILTSKYGDNWHQIGDYTPSIGYHVLPKTQMLLDNLKYLVKESDHFNDKYHKNDLFIDSNSQMILSEDDLILI